MRIIFVIHSFFVLAMTKAHFPAITTIAQDELAASNAIQSSNNDSSKKCRIREIKLLAFEIFRLKY